MSNIEDIDLELGQIDRADYGDDDEIFMADLYGAEGSAESKGRQKVVHLLAQINSKETHFANRPFKTDSTAQTESADQYKHDLKISLTSDDLSETQTSPAPTLVTQPSASDFDTAESRIDSGTQKSLHAGGKRSRSTDVTTADDDDTINVTRIIIGNLDAFIDRYPYFIDKVNGWTKVRYSPFYYMIS